MIWTVTQGHEQYAMW